MANWQREIMILANDFCLDTAKAKQICFEIDKIKVPAGEIEENYKYNKAYPYIKKMILAM